MKRFFKTKGALVALLLLPAIALSAIAVNSKVQASNGRDCTTNSIIYCGTKTTSGFISSVKANKTGDLPAIYSDFGLVSSQYSKFATSARAGTAYKDGRIVVDGQTVATNTWSIGRHKNTYTWNKVIAGKTYYASYNKDVFLSNSIPVMVLFNSKGVMQFAVLTSCSNPITGTKVAPTYSCNELTSKSVGNDTYQFFTKASAGNNAKISKVVYNFGDGTAPFTVPSVNSKVLHKYTKYGTFTATVTVYVHLPGNQTVTVQSVHCKTTITRKKPTPPPVVTVGKAACTQLQGVLTNSDAHEYTFTTYGTETNAPLINGTFNFGDGTTATNVAPLNGKVAVAKTHTYTKDGNYTITGKLFFHVRTLTNGKVTKNVGYTATCQTKVTVKTPVQYCKPGIPVGSPECKTSTMTCDSLTFGAPGTPDASGNIEETLIAQATAKNATIDSYTFNFDDNSQPQTVTTTASETSVTHTYAPGNYPDINVSVTMTDANGAKQVVNSSSCETSLTIKAPQCTPNSQKPECKPCKYNSNLPSNSPECTPPTPVSTTLPNTGAGNVAGIFTGVTLAAAFGYRTFLRRRLARQN